MSKKIYIPIAIALLIALLAGLWVSSDALAQGTGPAARLRGARRILGQVTAVGTDQFSIKTFKGKELSFLVDENTRYYNDGGTLKCQIKSGDTWVDQYSLGS